MENNNISMENLSLLEGLNENLSMDYKEDSTMDFIESNIICIDTEKLENSKIDSESFEKGVKSLSYLCGAITALVNVGINPNKAMDYLTEKEASECAMRHNLEIMSIQKDISLETAKLDFKNRVDNF